MLSIMHWIDWPRTLTQDLGDRDTAQPPMVLQEVLRRINDMETAYAEGGNLYDDRHALCGFHDLIDDEDRKLLVQKPNLQFADLL